MKIKYIHQSDPDKEKVMDSEVLRKADLDFARGLNGFREADVPDQEEYDRRLLKKLICEAVDKKIIRFEILEEKSAPDSDDEPHAWLVTGIDWDLDDDLKDQLGPDAEGFVPPPANVLIEESENVVEDDIADYLSDVYGWCVKGYVAQRV